MLGCLESLSGLANFMKGKCFLFLVRYVGYRFMGPNSGVHCSLTTNYSSTVQIEHHFCHGNGSHFVCTFLFN